MVNAPEWYVSVWKIVSGRGRTAPKDIDDEDGACAAVEEGEVAAEEAVAAAASAAACSTNVGTNTDECCDAMDFSNSVSVCAVAAGKRVKLSRLCTSLGRDRAGGSGSNMDAAAAAAAAVVVGVKVGR